MDNRNQSDDLRRVIKDILGSTNRRPDVDVPDGYIPAEPRPKVEMLDGPKPAVTAAKSNAEVEMPVGYQPAGRGSSASTPGRKSGRMKGLLLVAAAVVVIAVLAGFLIATNESILGFSLFGADGAAHPAGATAVAASSQAGGSFAGSGELRQALEEEQAKSAGLQEELDNLTADIERLRATGEAPNGELRPRVNQLEKDKEQLEERIAGLRRDLAASQGELNVLRGAADNSRSASEQLQQLDKEYRNVLTSLQQAQEAGRSKDQKIVELQSENNTLRKRITSTEQNQGSEKTRAGQSSAITPAEKEPVPIKTVKPKYPESAKRRRIEGTVKVRVLVSESGKVLQSKVLSSPDSMGALDRAALEAVQGWRFEPGQRNGKPAQMYFIVQLVFKL